MIKISCIVDLHFMAFSGVRKAITLHSNTFSNASSLQGPLAVGVEMGEARVVAIAVTMLRRRCRLR